MKKNTYTFLSLVSALAMVSVPVVAAAFSLEGSMFKDVINYILGLISLLIPILFALAFIVFFWGLSKFILNSGNKDGIEKGRNYMLWGVLALFILLTFRTIISLMTNELELGNSQNYPFLKTDAQQGNVTTGGSGFTR